MLSQLKKSRCEAAVRHALESGYRHIDTAYLYRNEGLIGKVLGEFVCQQKLKREQVFLVTKLWDIYHNPEKVQYACNLQRKALRVDYIDLYLMHSPVGVHYVSDEDLMPHVDGELWTNDVDYLDTYRAMEQLVEMGQVRSLGLSNFNAAQLERLLKSCQIKPVVLQIECHPGLVQVPLIELCKRHDITVVAYSPLGRPTPGRPTPEYLKDPSVLALAAKYGKTPAQVILRYLIDIGTVPIPKASQKDHLNENLDVFDFRLSPEELQHLSTFNRGERLWKFEKAKNHPHYPY